MVTYCNELASNREHAPPGVFVNDAHKPSIKLTKVPTFAPDVGHLEPAAEPTAGAMMGAPNLDITALEPSWTTPFLDYLLRDTLPADATKARCLARHAKTLVLIKEELYKRSPSDILQKCT
ncbi:uncharacterized protein [Setaria viridis]|uniref:uncharacterized protein n=1 Tax=Setaria viridis TaxID=4556 RepID=UPI0014937B57|nr:uncharacterized protein LOC117853581 [Setaria viridis]